MSTSRVSVGSRRSIAIAADVVSLAELTALVELANEFPIVSAVKVGFKLALRFGLSAVVSTIKSISSVSVIYDHQKAGTDIPQMGAPFAEACHDSGVDGVIIFPEAGPRTLEAFVSAALEQNLITIVGLLMTHPGYLASNGGYLVDDSPSRIRDAALGLGVKQFVVPGTDPNAIRQISAGFPDSGSFSLWMPGIGSQGGSLLKAFDAATPHIGIAIIGSSIYTSPDPRHALAAFASEI